MLGVGRSSKARCSARCAIREEAVKLCGFLFPLPGNCHRRRVEAAHDSITLRIKTAKLALGEMRPLLRRRLLPQQAQIAPLTPPSRTLSIPVCEFLFWTPATAEKGGGPASILQTANEKRGRLSRQN